MGNQTSPIFPEKTGSSVVIRDCFVDGAPDDPADTFANDFRALSVNCCHGAIVESNHIQNVLHGGPYNEVANLREVIVRNNVYRNVLEGPRFDNAALRPSPGISISSITVLRVPNPNPPPPQYLYSPHYPNMASVVTTTDHGFEEGDLVRITGNSGYFDGLARITVIPINSTTHLPETQIFYIETTVAPDVSGQSGGSIQRIIGVDKLLVEGNVFELPPNFPDAVGVTLPGSGGADYHSHQQAVIRNNLFRFADGQESTQAAHAILLEWVQSVVISGNLLSEITAPDSLILTSNCEFVTCFDNRTAEGELLLPDSDNYVPTLDVPADDTLALAVFEK